MNTVLKTSVKFSAKIVLSSHVIRSRVRSLISRSKFLDPKIRYTLRGWLESVAPEELLEARSDIIGGIFFYPNKCHIGLHAAEFGFWDENFPLLFDLFFSSARNIIEIGANIGIDTILMAKRVRNGSTIIAFEPSKKYRVVLERNIIKNKFKNVTVYDNFLSSRSNVRINLYINSASASAVMNGSPSFPTIDAQECTTITLDDFMKNHPSESLDLLKIDTDGWDQHIVEGGVDTIGKFKPFLFVEFSGYLLEKAGHSNDSFAKLLGDLGYNDFFLLKEKGTPMIPMKGYKELLKNLDPHSSSDVFAIPKGKTLTF